MTSMREAGERGTVVEECSDAAQCMGGVGQWLRNAEKACVHRAGGE